MHVQLACLHLKHWQKMGIDIRTLVLIIGIVHLMQVFIFYHQYKTNKYIGGPGWWLLWSAAESFGFIFILLRDVPSLLSVAIIFQNPIIFLGTIFLYYGTVHFFDKKVNFKLIATLYISYVCIHIFFFAAYDSLLTRTVVFDIYIALISFLTGFFILKNRTQSIASTANFIILIFALHGGIFVFRAFFLIHENALPSTVIATPINLVQYMDALMVGILWTFGFIMLLNLRLNAEISEAKLHFEMIFNTSPDAVIISSLADGRFVDCNEGFIKISGYTKHEITGKSTLDIQLWSKSSDRDLLINALKNRSTVENKEFLFNLKNGQTITGLMSASIITLKGQPHIISVIRDISELKKSEQEIQRKNEELLRVNAEKDRFLSIIAHDLKSPFNGFLGLTQIITENFRTLTRENIQTMAQSMRESATNLYRLLENLLQWSQIQKGSIAFKPTAIQLHKVVNEIMQLEEEHAKTKCIQFSSSIPLTLLVQADLNFLQTIIRNLVSNALKFTPQGGKIMITANNIDNQVVSVCVRDTGIGMSQQMIESLFRLDTDNRRPGTADEPSTGLGLILVKEFIEKNGGTIRVESEVDKGSAFYFTLPLAQNVEINNFKPNKSNDKTAPAKRIKVLIAEDDFASAILLSKGLERLSSKIFKAETGIQAVEICRQNKDIDLILMDIKLPLLNGLEATQQIREFNSDVFIIAQTAFDMPGYKEKALLAGCNYYTLKPINMQSLLHVIRNKFEIGPD